jgi:hypothetical protein
MDQATFTPADPAQLIQAQKVQALKQQLNSGAGWFFWIAGLSIINTVIYLFGSGMTFIIGLGLTQIVDGFAKNIAQESAANVAGLVQAASLILDLVIAGVFVLYGVMGRRKVRWAMIAGMVLYVLDGVIYLAVNEWVGVAFHLLALFYLGRGLLSMNKLVALEKPVVSAVGLSPYPQVSAFETVDSRPSAGLVLNIFAILGTLTLALLLAGTFVLFLLP